MAKIENIKIITEFESVGLKELQTQFDKLLASPKLDEQIRGEINTLFEHIKELGPKFKEQLAKGRITLKELGLDNLSKEAMDVFNSISEHLTGITFELPPQLEQEINDLNNQLEKLANTKANAEQSIEDIQVQKKQAKTKFGLRGAAADPDTMYAELSRLTTERAEAQAASDSNAVDKLNIKIKKQEEYIDTINKLTRSENGYIGKIAQVEGQEAKLNDELSEKEKKRQELIRSAEKLGTEEGNLIKGIIEYINNLKTESRAQNEVIQNQKKLSKATDNLNNSDSKHNDTLGVKITKTLSYYTILNQLKKLLSESVRTITELDKAMTEAAVVTEMNREQAWDLLGTYQKLAKETGLATSEISGVVVEFLKQGRSVADAMKLAEVAAKSAKIAGISSKEAVDYLTSAVNGFGLAASQAEDIADKFAAIAASSATDFEELAIAMSKVSPTAKSAGVGVDFMMGVIAKGLETTREAPENIGTAFKTIFARMREVTDLGKAAEDGMSLNRVEKALGSVDVKLRDASGQFRNLEDVLVDVGDKWDTLTSIEQAYLATALAGSRQQPRLLAIFNDFARTKELIQLSSDATGELNFQHMEYMEGMEASMTKLKTSWEQFITTITDSEIIIGVVNFISDSISSLSGVINFLSDNTAITTAAIVALGAVLAFQTALTVKNMKAKLASIAVDKLKIWTENGLAVVIARESGATWAQIAANKAAVIAGTYDVAAKGAQTVATIGLSDALKLLAMNAWASLLPLLPYIAAITVIAALIAAIVIVYNNASKGVSLYTDEIKKNNKAMDDMKKSVSGLDSLIEKYKELKNILSLTTEQQDELNSTIDQLKEYQIGDKTYNLTKTNFLGETVFDENAYQTALDDVAKANEKAMKDNVVEMNRAIKVFGKKAFDDDVISDTARKIGYDYGVSIIEGMGLGLEQTNLIKEDLASTLKSFENLSSFTTTKKELALTASTSGIGVTQIDAKIFDEERFKQFSEQITYASSHLQDFYQTNTGADAAALTNEINKYNEELSILLKYATNIEDKGKIELAFSTAFSGSAALKTLIEDRKISADVVLNFTKAGMNYEDLASMSTEVQGMVLNAMTGGNAAARPYVIRYGAEALQSSTNGILEEVSNIYNGSSEGYSVVAELMRGMGISEDKITEFLTGVFNASSKVTANQIATNVTDLNNTSKKFFDLQKAMAEGNFESYSEMATTYGQSVVDAFASGDLSAIGEAIDVSKAQTLADIEKRRNDILYLNGALQEDITEAEQVELDQLALMEDYTKNLTDAEFMRSGMLQKSSDAIKQMNDYLKIQQNLLNMGMDENSPFNTWLNNLMDTQYENSLDTLETQLQAEKNALEEYGSFDTNGIFMFNSDANSVEGQEALDGYFETYSQYIDTISGQFERQKAEITSMYSDEIAALKESNDERWKQIEYTDKLATLEDKVAESRRKLAGLMISNSTKSNLTAATDELNKLQQERQKMIEQQMVEQAQKELEAERDAKIQELGEQQIESMNNLILALDRLTGVVGGSTTQSGQIKNGKSFEEFWSVPTW